MHPRLTRNLSLTPEIAVSVADSVATGGDADATSIFPACPARPRQTREKPALGSRNPRAGDTGAVRGDARTAVPAKPYDAVTLLSAVRVHAYSATSLSFDGGSIRTMSKDA